MPNANYKDQEVPGGDRGEISPAKPKAGATFKPFSMPKVEQADEETFDGGGGGVKMPADPGKLPGGGRGQKD